MRDDEVLAARLPHDPGVVAVVGDVGADRLPHRLEHRRRPGEVDTCQLGARERRVADRRSGPVDEVDDPRGQARLFVKLQQEVSRVRGRRRRLPEHGVTHQRRARRQVAADRREVERCHREDEALERAVLHPVPRSRRGDRLLGVDAQHVLDVEVPEVDQLAGRVDLGLVRRLRLAEHRGGVEGCAPGAGEQLSGAEEDGRSILPGSAVPVFPGFGRGRDRPFDLGRPAAMDRCEDVVLVVRHHRLECLAGPHLLAADHERDLDLLGLHLAQPVLQLGALGRSGRVRPDRLVHRGRRSEESGCGAHWRRL